MSVNQSDSKISSPPEGVENDVSTRALGDIEVMICGSIAGTVSRTILNPLDVIKIRLQIQQESVAFAVADNLKTKHPTKSHHQVKYHGALGAFRTIVAEEGARGLWRGIIPGLCLVVPYTAVQFYVYDRSNRICTRLKANEYFSPTCISIVTGMIAGVSATVVSYPLDVIRTSLAAQGSQHHTMVAACSYLIRNVGYEGMFRGINPTLISVVPYSAVQFAAFNMVSTALTRAKGIAEGSVEVGRKPDAIVSSSSGLIAGALAKGLTHPLDVVKKRLQVSGLPRYRGFGAPIKMHQYRDMWDCIRKGLYKGYFASVTKAAPASAITFTVYKETEAFFKNRKQGNF